MSKINYSLKIRTAKSKYAGTDNNVFINVYGERDGEEVNTGEINLSKRVNGNAFEKGKNHSLNFVWEDIGRPFKIKLRLSNDLLDDWRFEWCKIQRKTETKGDEELNREVTFSSLEWYSRKESHIYEGVPSRLKENIVKVTEEVVYGGTSKVRLASGVKRVLNTSFVETRANAITKSVVTESSKTHVVNDGTDLGYSAGTSGGWHGGGSISYGFSYTTLERICTEKSNSVSKEKRESETTEIMNSSNEDKTYALVSELVRITIKRSLTGTKEPTFREDVINLGTRICAVLPLKKTDDGFWVYVDNGKNYKEDKLWDYLQ